MRNGSGPGRGGRLATLGGLAALMLVMAAPAVTAGHVGTLVAFDPAAFEFPEGIAADKTGNLYVSMPLLDQIRRIDQDGAQSVYAQLPSGAAPAGLKLNADGTLYVAAGGFNLATGLTEPATRGVYRVAWDGSAERLAGTGAILFPNDLTFDKRGNIYVTDTAGGKVYRVGTDGSVELWAEGPLLEGTGALGFGFPIGANGIAFRHNELVVANPEKGLLASIPIEPDGAAGELGVVAESAALLGADGIAFDVHGDIYVGVNVQSTLVAIRTDGSIDTLATAAEGLNQPSTVAFGTGMGDRQTLFLVNLSIFVPAPTPGVLEVAAGVPGQPVP